MTWRVWATFYYTLSKASCLGKEFPLEPKKKSMKKSETKNCPLRSSNFVKIYQKRSGFISGIVDLSNLRKNQILVTFENYSRTCFIEVDMSTIMCLTGWSKNQMCQKKFRRSSRKTSKKQKAAREFHRQGTIKRLNNSFTKRTAIMTRKCKIEPL